MGLSTTESESNMQEVISAPEKSIGQAPAKKPSVILAKAAAAKILEALGTVTGVIQGRHSVPILANVLIAKRGSELQFTGSDMELQMRSHAELGYGESDVATSVNARKLMDMLKAMPAEQTVTLTLNGEKLIVAGGKSRFTVQTLPASDFPLVVPNKAINATIQIEQKVLADLIRQVHYAM